MGNVHYLPALVLLLFLFGLLTLVLQKMSQDTLWKFLSGVGLTPVLAFVLFALICIVHLAAPQDWSADILKVLAGLVVGSSTAVGVSGLANRNMDVDAANSTIGAGAKFAGGDITEITESIEKMYGQVGQIHDSVITLAAQEAQIAQVAARARPPSGVEEYLFLTSFVDKEEVIGAAADALRKTQTDGWELLSMSSTYSAEGVLMTLHRFREPESWDVEISPGVYRRRIYHGPEFLEI